MKLRCFLVALLCVGCNRPADKKVEEPEKVERVAEVQSAEGADKVEQPEKVAEPEAPEPSLVARAVSARTAESFEKCVKLFQAAAGDDDSSLASGYLYAAGCCASQGGFVDVAFVHLNAAVERGFKASETLKQESVLTGLHEDPRWPKLVSLIEEYERANLKATNAELATIFEQDQSERHGDYVNLDWSKLGPRDAQRRVRVTEILESGGATTSEDYYHAAMVFQHGTSPEEPVPDERKQAPALRHPVPSGRRPVETL